MPLYDRSCPACPPHILSIPVLPVLLLLPVAAVFGSRLGWHPVRIAFVGLVSGVAATLYLTLLTDTGPRAITDPYLTWPYRTYTLLYISAAIGFFVAVARSPAGSAPWIRSMFIAPLSAVLCVAVASNLVRRLDLAAIGVAAAAVAGAIIAVVLARLYATVRPRILGPSTMLAGVVLAGFLIRAGFGLQLLARSGPGLAFAVNGDDGDTYYANAVAFAAGERLPQILANTTYPPGYAVFAAAIFRTTDESLAALIVAQALVAALGCLALYGIARQIVGRHAGIIAAALFAMDANLIQNSSTMNAEAVVLPLFLAAMWATLRAWTTDRLLWFAAAGVLFGLAFVSRSLIALAMLVAVFWLLLPRVRSSLLPRARTVAGVGVMVLAFLIPAVPTAVSAYQLEGRPRITTQVASLAWDLDGNGITIDNRELVARGIHPVLEPAGSLAAVLKDPAGLTLFLAGAVPDRLRALFFYPAPGHFDPLLVLNPASGSSYPQFAEAILIALAAYGVLLLATRRQGRRATLLIAGFGLLYVAVLALLFPPFHPFRYRIPLMPLAFLAESLAAVALVRWLASAATRRTPDVVRASRL